MEMDHLDWVRQWLSTHVLPHWWVVGRDPVTGGFYEALDFNGQPLRQVERRGRVTPRQLYAFALARHFDLFEASDFEETMVRGSDYLLTQTRHVNGGFAGLIGADGKTVLAPALLYDVAFMALAGAELSKLGLKGADQLCDAAFTEIERRFADHAYGGFMAGDGVAAKLANPHMHLLEAHICRFDACGGRQGGEEIAEILKIFERHFYDPDNHVVHEQRNADFGPSETNWVEPGHGLEWAYLYCAAKERLETAPDLTIAHSLLAHAERSAVTITGHRVMPNRIDAGGVTASARLWPQLEWLRTVHTLEPERDLDPILSGIRRLYLEKGPDTGWVDAIDESGKPCAPHIPASMIYHLMTAFGPLLRRRAKVETKDSHSVN